MQGGRGVAIAASRPSRCAVTAAAVSPQSVTGVFCPAHTDVALVSCGLERGHFIISDVPFPGSALTVLKVRVATSPRVSPGATASPQEAIAPLTSPVPAETPVLPRQAERGYSE